MEAYVHIPGTRCRVVEGVIIRAKIQAYEVDDVAQLLNDFELIPEYVADEVDRSEEFLATLLSLAQVYPSLPKGCRRIRVLVGG